MSNTATQWGKYVLSINADLETPWYHAATNVNMAGELCRHVELNR